MYAFSCSFFCFFPSSFSAHSSFSFLVFCTTMDTEIKRNITTPVPPSVSLTLLIPDLQYFFFRYCRLLNHCP
ncbi:uncharacterized protein P884DRAFT_252941 [Thermothelomyces heterothallicus CBS 202.75]|uniref:uncharacterized protein n=1 Tax=Thermothelomyces heterothallicus CBS 202.75 TaxID=1149848 RepID=UPI00374363EE